MTDIIDDDMLGIEEYCTTHHIYGTCHECDFDSTRGETQ